MTDARRGKNHYTTTVATKPDHKKKKKKKKKTKKKKKKENKKKKKKLQDNYTTHIETQKKRKVPVDHGDATGLIKIKTQTAKFNRTKKPEVSPKNAVHRHSNQKKVKKTKKIASQKHKEYKL